MPSKISINRAPVLTLWAAVVGYRLGFTWKEALSLGKAVARLNAQAKGRRLPEGTKGWGAKGVLDLRKILAMAKRKT